MFIESWWNNPESQSFEKPKNTDDIDISNVEKNFSINKWYKRNGSCR